VHHGSSEVSHQRDGSDRHRWSHESLFHRQEHSMSGDAPFGRGEKLCPSAPPQEGALVITIMGTDGKPAYIPDRMPLSAETLDSIDAATLEKRFRFASPCRTGLCAHWNGESCSIPGKLIGLLPSRVQEQLPRCSIRHDCRWFSQAGPEACRLCPLVVRTEESQEIL